LLVVLQGLFLALDSAGLKLLYGKDSGCMIHVESTTYMGFQESSGESMEPSHAQWLIQTLKALILEKYSLLWQKDVLQVNKHHTRYMPFC